MSNLIGRIFAFDPRRRTWIIASWAVFMLAVLAMILGSCLIFEQHRGGSERMDMEELEPIAYRHSTLLMAVVSNVLIIVNTVFFVIQLMIVFWERIPRRDNKKTLVWLSGWLVGGYILAIVCSLGIINTFSDKVRELSVLSWGEVYERNKWLSLAIFLIFLVADIMLYKLVDESDSTGGDGRPGEEPLLDFIRKQLLYIDFPGLVGVLLIAIISWLHYHFNLVAAGVFNPNGVYIEGFTVGAIAMQIMFSQFNFAMVNAQNGSALPKSQVRIERDETSLAGVRR